MDNKTNHKAPWTDKEETELCHKIKLGVPIEKISKTHQRTEKAIEMRMASIFKKRLNFGEKMSVLCHDFNLTEKQIKNYIHEAEENKKKYETNNNTNDSNIMKKNINLQDIFKKLDVLEGHLNSIEKRLDKIEQIDSHIYKNLKKK
tara:strand:- start:757 stop:1194 length:438 start_codon:yes stop_codon:yes gene_type:complete